MRVFHSGMYPRIATKADDHGIGFALDADDLYIEGFYRFTSKRGISLPKGDNRTCIIYEDKESHP